MTTRICLLALWLLALAGLAHGATIDKLRCEYRSNPLGLDATRPRLSWILLSDQRGAKQSAYQIQVASSPQRLARHEGDLWDSGKVASDASIQLEYGGKPLAARQSCYWQVRVWDSAGQVTPWSKTAFWTMGLLSPTEWQAQWIGLNQTPELPLPPSTTAPRLLIRRAVYGAVDGTASVDVTALLASRVHDGGLSLVVSNEAMGGDPALNHPKRLRVEYEVAGHRMVKEVNESAQLSLPKGFVPDTPANAQTATPRYLRKTFTVGGAVRRATLYATALGLYELHLNGTRVGDHLLAPEWTNYYKRIQYQTYDVTALLKPGANTLGALLGNGWYCGDWQQWQSKLKPIYGDQPYLRAQLEIERADGTRQTISSDGTWRGTTDGPLRFSGIYEGETFDARRAMHSWDTPAFAARNWRPATIATPRVRQLVWQRSEPIRVTQEIKPIAVTEPKPGVYVFDLGQNIAGWCRLHLREPSGTVITLQHNEVLNPDGTVYMDNLHAGHLSTGNRQIVRYICGGGDETYEPHFTYQGFRFIEVAGLTHRPAPDFLIARVFHTSFTQTGTFTCSNSWLNRLAQNIQWSQRANMMGVPTDCCQRDERCGYTGDAQFFMPTALYNFDVAAFFNKWLVDVDEDAQMPDGHFADHAPTFGPGDGWNVGWSDAGIICPYLFYRAYGDTRLIRDHYAAMRRNIEAQIAIAPEDTRDQHLGNSDWLNLGGGVAKPVVGTAYYAYDMRLMSEMAAAIGEDKDAADYARRAAKIRAAFAQNFIDEQGRIKDSSQTGYALAFTMGLVPPAKQTLMAARFADEIARFDGHLATGFIGTPRLLPGLRAAGRDDLAYKLLLNDTFPSWLYPVKLGATTMWERWDGWRPAKGFADAGMNSFNHYSFGAVGQYLFGMVGGIQETSPGYKTIQIHPVINPGLTWANTSFDSPYGRIISNWHREPNRLTLDITIPANTAATIYVPAPNAAAVTESGKLASGAKSVKFLRMQDDAAVYQVGAGHYQFAVMHQND